MNIYMDNMLDEEVDRMQDASQDACATPLHTHEYVRLAADYVRLA